LKDAGYLEVNLIKGPQGITYEDASIVRLKMSGHEYLDTVRSPEVWKKTKTTLEKVGGGAALAVVKEIATKIAVEILKAHTHLQ
jgi:hypothetical protein